MGVVDGKMAHIWRVMQLTHDVPLDVRVYLICYSCSLHMYAISSLAEALAAPFLCIQSRAVLSDGISPIDIIAVISRYGNL